jgi:hypothetical protein
LVRIGFVLLLGSGTLAGRLIWEMTVWTWESGPQMVGFKLVHSAGIALLLFPLLLACWLPIAVAHLLWRRWKRRPWSRAELLAAVLSIVVFGILWLPYGFWQRLFVDRLSHGPHAGQFLVYAAALGDLATVEAFVGHGVSTNIRDRSGSTALHGASVQGQTKVIRYLISAGADINATNRMGRSALQIAISEHHDDSAKVLMELGAIPPKRIEEQGGLQIDEQMRQNLERTDFPQTAPATDQ